MTVNERLWVSGLMDEFDRGIKERDIDEVVLILKKVELTQENIDSILKHHKLID